MIFVVVSSSALLVVNGSFAKFQNIDPSSKFQKLIKMMHSKEECILIFFIKIK